MPPRPLFIASLGNPSPTYDRTLHSAGHIIANELSRTPAHAFTPFSKSRVYANGQVALTSTNTSSPSDWTIWKCPSEMNVSGTSLAKAWRAWRGEREERMNRGVLVVLHDELESELGKLRVRKSEASAKGHNGIKDVVRTMGTKGWLRIAVGIGRPESREPADVARWVLRKMTAKEWVSICNTLGPVMGLLRQIEEEEI